MPLNLGSSTSHPWYPGSGAMCTSPMELPDTVAHLAPSLSRISPVTLPRFSRLEARCSLNVAVSPVVCATTRCLPTMSTHRSPEMTLCKCNAALVQENFSPVSGRVMWRHPLTKNST